MTFYGLKSLYLGKFTQKLVYVRESPGKSGEVQGRTLFRKQGKPKYL